jgi:glycosyltransferase involved in cell wall biosynthesis
MHILFLTDNFPPEANAPALRTYENSLEWVRLGHQVTVITCAPNFPQGRVFWGYENKIWQTEFINGIKVIRVWTYITANEGIVKRSLDYVSFMFSSFFASFFVKNIDVVIGTSPQFFTVLSAYLTSLVKRRPWVFELRDLWPESIKAVGALKNKRIIQVLEKVELFLYRKSNKVIAVTKSFKENLIARGVDANKISVITNGVNINNIFPLEKDPCLLEKFNLSKKFVIGYIGTHGMAHALSTVIEAAQKIQSSPLMNTVTFLFIGDGAEKKQLIESVNTKNLQNVIFIDSVPKHEIQRFWSLLDVSVIHLKKTSLFKTVIPSKLFESMGMGLPVLHGVEGESAEIVKKFDMGMTFEPESIDDLCTKISLLINSPETLIKFKDNSLKASRYFEREKLAREMVEEINLIL